MREFWFGGNILKKVRMHVFDKAEANQENNTGR